MLRKKFYAVTLILVLAACISSGCSKKFNTQNSFRATSTPPNSTTEDAAPDIATESLSPTELPDSEDEMTIIDTQNKTIEDTSYGYYYNQLTDSQKVIYTSIFSNYSLIQNEFIKFIGVDINDFYRSINAIAMDQYFFTVSNVQYYYVDGENGLLVKLVLSNNLTDKQIEEVKEEAKKILNKIDGTDEEIVRNIYNWCTKNIEYDKTLSENNIRNIYGALINKKSVCAGYAKAFSYLCTQKEIMSIYVSSEDHAWNYVQINSKWYAIDTTWGSPNTKKYLLEGQEFLNNEDHIPTSDYFSFPTLSSKSVYPEKDEVQDIITNLQDNIKICTEKLEGFQSQEYDENLYQLYYQANEKSIEILNKINSSIFYYYANTDDFLNDFNELNELINEINEY